MLCDQELQELWMWNPSDPSVEAVEVIIARWEKYLADADKTPIASKGSVSKGVFVPPSGA